MYGHKNGDNAFDVVALNVTLYLSFYIVWGPLKSDLLRFSQNNSIQLESIVCLNLENILPNIIEKCLPKLLWYI